MNIRKILWVSFAVLFCTALVLYLGHGRVARAAASQQVVFSGGGVFTDDALSQPITPFGFWIWCEGASANPYQGSCNGAMYFYALGITKGVFGSATSSGGVFTMNVHSADGKVACSLSNATPVLSGPSNKVTATCTAPAQVTDNSDSDTMGLSTNAVVNITGPSN